MDMLATSGLGFAYPGRAPLVFPDVTLSGGEAVALIGPSGSGKSTLLMLIAGLIDPQTGTVRVAGRDLASTRGTARDRFRGRTMGVVLQSFRLLPRLTVLENLTAAQYLSGTKVDPASARIVLASLDIADLANEKPNHLSRGQLQRAAIARAIVNGPQLLLADEPTSSLDDTAAAASLTLLLAESHRLGAGLLIATHDQRVKTAVSRIIELPAQQP